MKVRKLLNILAVLFVMAGLVAGMSRASATMADADSSEKIEGALLERFTVDGWVDAVRACAIARRCRTAPLRNSRPTEKAR